MSYLKLIDVTNTQLKVDEGSFNKKKKQNIKNMRSHQTYERIFKISTFLYHDLRPDGIVFNKWWFLYGILIKMLGLLALCFIKDITFPGHHTVVMMVFNCVSSLALAIEIFTGIILFTKSYELASVMHFCWKCHMPLKAKKSSRQICFLKIFRSALTIEGLLFYLLLFSMTIMTVIWLDNFPSWFTTTEFIIVYGVTMILQTTLKMIPIALCTFFLFFSNAMKYRTNQLVKLANKCVLQHHFRTPDVPLSDAAIGYEDFLLRVRMFFTDAEVF